MIPNPVGLVGTTQTNTKGQANMEELKVTPETIRGVAEAKVRYWQEQVAKDDRELLVVFDYSFLQRYKRSYRQLLAAEAHLENLPRAGGVK